MIQAFLLVKASFPMVELDTEKIVSWKSFKVCQQKTLLLLPLLIIVFLYQLNGTEIQIFVYYLKEAA